MDKKALRVFGFILIIVGIIILIFGFANLGAFSNNFFGGGIDAAFGSFGNATRGILQMFLGGVFIIVGGFMVYASYIGKIISYVTKEASPGVETVSNAVGKGFSKGYKKKKK